MILREAFFSGGNGNREVFPLASGFLALEGEREGEVKELVKRQGGTLKALVHPFFGLHQTVLKNGGLNLEEVVLEAAGKIRLSREKYSVFMARSKELGMGDFGRLRFNGLEFTKLFKDYLNSLLEEIKSAGLFLLVEEGSRLEDTEKALRQLGFGGKLLTYSTMSRSSLALPNVEPEAMGKLFHQAVGEKMLVLELSRLVVLGQYVDFEMASLVNKGPYVLSPSEIPGVYRCSYLEVWPEGRCGSGFAQRVFLESGCGFEVSFSQACFPFSNPWQKGEIEGRSA